MKLEIQQLPRGKSFDGEDERGGDVLNRMRDKETSIHVGIMVSISSTRQVARLPNKASWGLEIGR